MLLSMFGVAEANAQSINAAGHRSFLDGAVASSRRIVGTDFAFIVFLAGV